MAGVAAGWERRRGLFATRDRDASERMVELLDPQPGRRFSSSRPGRARPGSWRCPAFEPGGELISTDVAPEMVEAARRRAARARARPASASRSRMRPTSRPSRTTPSTDPLPLRHDARARHGGALPREIARVLRPGGRAVLAVWASPRLNPWMTAPGRAALELGLHGAARPGRARARSGSPIPSGCGRSSLAEASRSSTVEDVPVHWVADVARRVVGDDLRHSRMLAPARERLTPTEVAALRARPKRYLAEYLADDGSLTRPRRRPRRRAAPARGLPV